MNSSGKVGDSQLPDPSSLGFLSQLMHHLRDCFLGGRDHTSYGCLIPKASHSVIGSHLCLREWGNRRGHLCWVTSREGTVGSSLSVTVDSRN